MLPALALHKTLTPLNPLLQQPQPARPQIPAPAPAPAPTIGGTLHKHNIAQPPAPAPTIGGTLHKHNIDIAELAAIKASIAKVCTGRSTRMHTTARVVWATLGSYPPILSTTWHRRRSSRNYTLTTRLSSRKAGPNTMPRLTCAPPRKGYVPPAPGPGLHSSRGSRVK
jgi:hypothetical protein